MKVIGSAAESEVLEADNYCSDTLTVWRFLHLERDSMAAPGAAEVFDGAGVGNDDVDPGNLGNTWVIRISASV